MSVAQVSRELLEKTPSCVGETIYYEPDLVQYPMKKKKSVSVYN